MVFVLRKKECDLKPEESIEDYPNELSDYGCEIDSDGKVIVPGSDTPQPEIQEIIKLFVPLKISAFYGIVQ